MPARPQRRFEEPTRGARSLAIAAPDNAGVLALPPLLYGAAFALGVPARWIWPEPPLPPVISVVVGLPLLLLGGIVATWANRTLQLAGTTPNPRLPTTALVVTGPFRYSRNPLYLARTLLYVGLALATSMLWTFVTLVPLLVIIQYRVIRREERYLHSTFGLAYRRYCFEVRRWL